MIEPMNKQLITLYGISNCDTVKKARTWLTSQGLDYQFHDFKKQGVPDQRLDAWIEARGWQALVNSRGTTWRRLDDDIRACVTDAASARSLMLTYPSVIKRPVVQWADGQVTVGFNEPAWRLRIG
jgi:Spx/MgsR family transcriptional regulator